MSLEMFSRFGRKSTKQEPIKSHEVWSYTRVSTKDQKDNNESLENQDEVNSGYALKRQFNITSEFGKTNESASSDDARKIFKSLIFEIKKARNKPYAILIFTMSRFSRTGGNAIGIAKELVEDYGVHLIETSTGISTESEVGKIEIYHRLLEARKENLTRLSVTIPGMIKFVQKGYRLGNAPRGYTHFGPRVKDEKRHSQTQILRINTEGELIKQAWKWKLQGLPDYIIRTKLKEMGLVIPKASLNAMWKNPFYCGIQNNSLLDGHVVYGKWEKMISEEEFLMVQSILDGSTQFGKKHDKINKNRPLVGHLFCSKCGKKMTGYEVKKKGIHYYKCQFCVGETINCYTTKHSKGIGANDLFKETLKKYEIDSVYIEPLKEQLTMTYNTINNDTEKEGKILEEKKNELETKLKNIRRKHALDELDKSTYDEVKSELESELRNIITNLSLQDKKLSNLNSFIESAINVSQNLSNDWDCDDIIIKRKVQELVFPDGVKIDVSKRQYLTKRENQVLSIIREMKSVSEGQKENGSTFFVEPSSLVAGIGLEPMTFGL